jgi:hypothetical protein
VILAAFEGEVGDEAVFDPVVLAADALAEFDGEGRRDGNGARHVPVVVRDGDRAGSREDPSDHIAAVEAADLVDDPADLAGLGLQHPLGQGTQVEPCGNRQAQQTRNEGGDQQRPHGSLPLRKAPLAEPHHGRSGRSDRERFCSEPISSFLGRI